MDICNNCLHNGMCSKEPCYLGFGKDFKEFLDYLSIAVFSGQPIRCEKYKLLNMLMKQKAERDVEVFVKEMNAHDLIVYTKNNIF